MKIGTYMIDLLYLLITSPFQRVIIDKDGFMIMGNFRLRKRGHACPGTGCQDFPGRNRCERLVEMASAMTSCPLALG